MREMDCVEITVENDKYTAEGVHRGMQGWICHDECADGIWLVNFPKCGEKEDIATIGVRETDMKAVPVMSAAINEYVKCKIGNSMPDKAAYEEKPCAVLAEERDEYASAGVHRGMQGWICHDECAGDVWPVNFPQSGEKGEAKTIGVAQADMYPLPEAPDERVNRIISQWYEKTKSDYGESLNEYII